MLKVQSIFNRVCPDLLVNKVSREPKATRV